MKWLHTDGGMYWFIFVAAFLGVAVWESVRPRVALLEPVERRWGRHALLVFASMLTGAILLPMSPFLLAASRSGSHYGLLNQPWIPFAARWILAILLLDLTRYASHRAMHSFYPLWRLHQIHHSDRDFDGTTGVRGHPLEGILTKGATLVTIAIFAPPVSAVLLAELVSVFESFFTHANAALPEWLQRPLGWFFFTSNAHVIHHSVEMRQQNNNFGDIFPWWDRIFGTYHPPLAEGKRQIVIGLDEYRHDPSFGFVALLKLPFTAKAAVASLDEPRTKSTDEVQQSL